MRENILKKLADNASRGEREQRDKRDACVRAVKSRANNMRKLLLAYCNNVDVEILKPNKVLAGSNSIWAGITAASGMWSYVQWKFGSRTLEVYFDRESLTNKVHGVVRVLTADEDYPIFSKCAPMGLDDSVYTMLATTLHEQLVENEQSQDGSSEQESDSSEQDSDSSEQDSDSSEQESDNSEGKKVPTSWILERLEQAVAKTEEKLQANYQQSVVYIRQLLALATQLAAPALGIPDPTEVSIGRTSRPHSAEMRWSISGHDIVLHWFIIKCEARIHWRITTECTGGGLYHDETVEMCDQTFYQAGEQTTVLPAVIECLQTQFKTAQSARGAAVARTASAT